MLSTGAQHWVRSLPKSMSSSTDMVTLVSPAVLKSVIGRVKFRSILIGTNVAIDAIYYILALYSTTIFEST